MSHPYDHIERRIVRSIARELADLRPELEDYLLDERFMPLVLTRIHAEGIASAVVRALESLERLDRLSAAARRRSSRDGEREPSIAEHT